MKVSKKRSRTCKENAKRGERFEDFLADYLGLRKQSGSGSGCIEREDLLGQGFLMQLKSTNKESISIKLDDLKKLMLHAEERDLDPVFAIGFERKNRFLPSRIFLAVPLPVWMERK